MYHKVEFNMFKVKGSTVNAVHVNGNKHYFLFASGYQYINLPNTATTITKIGIPVLVEIHYDPDTANCDIYALNTPTVIREIVDTTAGPPKPENYPRYIGSNYQQAHFFSKRLNGFILPIKVIYPGGFVFPLVTGPTNSYNGMQGVLLSLITDRYSELTASAPLALIKQSAALAL